MPFDAPPDSWRDDRREEDEKEIRKLIEMTKELAVGANRLAEGWRDLNRLGKERYGRDSNL